MFRLLCAFLLAISCNVADRLNQKFIKSEHATWTRPLPGPGQRRHLFMVRAISTRDISCGEAKCDYQDTWLTAPFFVLPLLAPPPPLTAVFPFSLSPSPCPPFQAVDIHPSSILASFAILTMAGHFYSGVFLVSLPFAPFFSLWGKHFPSPSSPPLPRLHGPAPTGCRVRAPVLCCITPSCMDVCSMSLCYELIFQGLISSSMINS